jgi:hypothetical protein
MDAMHLLDCLSGKALDKPDASFAEPGEEIGADPFSPEKTEMV